MEEQLSVLIVEDQKDGRQVLADSLGLMGFAVSTADEGACGVELARQLRPSVILMDLAMPGVDGWEATRRLKQDEATRHIPIVVLTAFSDRRARERAMEMGCAETLLKPIHPPDLLERLLVHARSARGGS